MDTETLYRFPVKVTGRELPRAWYWQRGKDEKFVVAYSAWDGSSLTLIWTVIDLNIISVKKVEIALESALSIESLQLAYHAMTDTWLLADLEFGFGNPESRNTTTNDYLVLRAIRNDESGQVLTSHRLFDDPANDMAVMGPLLTLESSDETSWLIYVKQEQDNLGAEVCRVQITFSSGQVKHSIVDHVRIALYCWRDPAWILLSCGLSSGEFMEDKGIEYRRSLQWRLSLMGKKNETSTPWLHHFERGIAETTDDDLRAGPLVASAAAIEGPTRSESGLSTFVVGTIMMNTRDNPDEKYRITAKTNILEQVDRLFCIDAEGNLVQTYQGSVGLYMGLCRAKKRVVGVDLVGNQWRLWTWRPLEQPLFDQMVFLDQEVQRACAIAENEPGQDDTCWLIEEYADLVTISKRSAVTLEQVTSPVVLSGMHLLLPQSGYGRLDWHTEVDALVHDDMLLLLAVDNDDQLVLFRIRENQA